MKISIIMVTFNSDKTLRSAIKSIKSQTDVQLELVVIDGGSTDETLNILKEFNSTIDILISEADEGTYDALNKGLRQCTGDIVGILHSDDVFANKDSLSMVSKKFKESSCSVVYGNIDFFKGNLIKRRWNAGVFKLKKIKNGWHPPHPAFFVKKELILTNNIYYDTSYKICADLKWMIKILSIANEVIHLNETLIYMRLGGASTTLKGQLTSFKEFNSIYKELGFSKFQVALILLKRYVLKLKQLFLKEENIITEVL